MTPIYFFYVFIIVVLFVMLFSKHKKWKEYFKTVILMILPSCFAFLVFFRFNIFFVPVLYISVGLLMSYILYIYSESLKAFVSSEPFLSIIAIFFFSLILSSVMFTRPLIIDDDIKEAMIFVNTLDPGCVVSDYGRGHIYQSLTDKVVIFKAHPNSYSKLLNLTPFYDCVYIWDKKDMRTWNHIQDESEILKLPYRQIPNTRFYYYTKDMSVI